MNILIIKLSSLGDVIHNLPIVWDIRARYPDARIDWLVEEAYVSLLQPMQSCQVFNGIDHIIPVALRRWKKSLGSKHTYQEVRAFLRQLRSVSYDVVIETQGLLKSASMARLVRHSNHAIIAGLANATQDSSYEPLARLFYTKGVQVPTRCHAIERSRRVVAAALGLDEVVEAPDLQFYPPNFICQINQKTHCQRQFPSPYVLFFHATARTAKRWSEANWAAVGITLARQGRYIVLPWGSEQERVVSDRLGAQIPNAIVPDAFDLTEAFAMIACAELTVGLDTGLTHLSAAMNKPTIELYCDSPRWKTGGYWSENIKNLGDTGQPPSVDEVLQAVMQFQQVKFPMPE